LAPMVESMQKIEKIWRNRIYEEKTIEAHIVEQEFEDALRRGDDVLVKNVDEILGAIVIHNELRMNNQELATGIEEALVRVIARVCDYHFLALDTKLVERMMTEAICTKQQLFEALLAIDEKTLVIFLKDDLQIQKNNNTKIIFASNLNKEPDLNEENIQQEDHPLQQQNFDQATETMEKMLTNLILPENMAAIREALSEKQILKKLAAAWSPLLSADEGQHVLEIKVLSGPLRPLVPQHKKKALPSSLMRYMEKEKKQNQQDQVHPKEEILNLKIQHKMKQKLLAWLQEDHAIKMRGRNMHHLRTKLQVNNHELNEIIFAPWFLSTSLRVLLESYPLAEDEILIILNSANKLQAAQNLLKKENHQLTVPCLEKAITNFIHTNKNKAKKNIDPTSEDKHEKNLLAQIITPDQIAISYDAIGGLESIKQILREAITYPLKYPHLYTNNLAREAVKGVLLFGPPGTGKTLLAKAVATEGGASFLAIDASVIENKWLGESEKNAKAVFTLARKLAPCVIFIDEIDSILSSRENDDSSHGTLTSVKTTLMQEWDGLKTSPEERVIVIGSTNRPYDLDEAVLRRLPRRILVDLPDFKTRLQILKVTLREARLASDVNLIEIAKQLEGYSGSDIREICREAVIRVAHAQAKQLESQTPFLQVMQDRTLRPVTQADFIAALRKLSASVSSHSPELHRILDWNDRYGEHQTSSSSTRRRRDAAHSPLYL